MKDITKQVYFSISSNKKKTEIWKLLKNHKRGRRVDYGMKNSSKFVRSFIVLCSQNTAKSEPIFDIG